MLAASELGQAAGGTDDRPCENKTWTVAIVFEIVSSDTG